MNPHAKDMHALNEVDDNARKNTRIRKEQEQEQENNGAGYSPNGGEQQVTGPVIDSTRQLAVVLVEHRNEPC